MNILVIDVGGTNIKVLVSGQNEHRKIPSGLTMTPRRMVAEVKKITGDWKYEGVSIGYPGVVKDGRVVTDPVNLAPGWKRFNFKGAFRRPVRIMNDAAMQALGSYKSGLLLFVGLGTGMGSALVAGGVVVPLELGHLPFRKGIYEDYLGKRGMERFGKKKWRGYVDFVLTHFMAAFQPDDVVVGGGNVKKLKKLPAGCRPGTNAHAFLGGFRLWEALGGGKGFVLGLKKRKKREGVRG